jgi:hypothetical protein
MYKKFFRFDDICINTDLKNAIEIAEYIKKNVPNVEIIFCISPLVHDISSDDEDNISRQRVFPKIFNAYSDFRKFYEVDKCGIPEIPTWITRGSHSLIHVDHRLLTKEAQEMSILVSCSLIKASIFVPPFNKWNKNTEDICKEYDIKLIKFEDEWKCCEYNEYNHKHNLWYLHSREHTLESFKKWLKI